MTLSRREFLAGGGALVVSFSLGHALAQQVQEAQNAGAEPRKPLPLPGSLKSAPFLDAWIRIDAKGVTVFTGKAELGQGIKTALVQVAAEELSVDPRRIRLVTADTAATPNEGYTAGSHSMQDSGTAIRHAAAQARELLITAAAAKFDMPRERLSAKSGSIVSDNGRSLSFGELVDDRLLHVQAEQDSKLKDRASHTVMGKPLPRLDIPAKLTGGEAYVQDMRLPGMVHARVARPPGYGARLKSVDLARVGKMPGVLKVVRDGSFLAVIAEREFQAVSALRVLGQSAVWEERESLPVAADVYAQLLKATSQDTLVRDAQVPATGEAKVIESSYRRPYQMHASIGPSCAIGLLQDDALTVWTHSQGVYPLRNAIAEMMRMPAEKVRCVHVEGSGCYGHNAADDAAADAALLARALPGRPVRVQWMREHEHAWEPYGPAMTTTAKASLDASGNITSWQYDVWSNTHSMRPGEAGHLLAAQHLENAFAVPAPRPIPQPEGGGDRNSVPLYRLPGARIVSHFIPAMPLRVSALRSLGAYLNVFSIESFMDELARAAGADPVEFRLKHLDDPRAQAVVRTAAERFGWKGWKRARGRGRGLAFARYKNLGAYAAVALEAQLDRNTGALRVRRAIIACDSGEVVNPDGVRNQMEGGLVQSISWTTFEEVSFDTRRITSRDWSGYPILRFSAVPETVEVHVIDRPGQPFLGTGEAAQGPVAAALANALADASGVRIRELPLSPARLRRALGP